MSPEELTAMTIYQVGALKGFLDAEDVPLHHVKPHGVLYGMMCRDYETAKAVMQEFQRVYQSLVWLARTWRRLRTTWG